MNISFDKKNIQFTIEALGKIDATMKRYACSIDTTKPMNKADLTFLDLLLRQSTNLRVIKNLLIDYSQNKQIGYVLPIGLIIRCCLEDAITIAYLFIFIDNTHLLENEINISSIDSIKKGLLDQIFHAPKYWKCSKEEKERIQNIDKEQILKFKKEHPEYFDIESLEPKKTYEIRNISLDWEKYFNPGELKNNDIIFKINKIEEAYGSFGNIYNLYKFFCLFEHYSYASRNILIFNEYTFTQLVVSIEYVIRSMLSIIDLLNANQEFIEDLKTALKILQKIIK